MNQLEKNGQNNTKQLLHLNNKHENLVSTLNNIKQTQNNELTKMNFTFVTQFKNFDSNLSLLNESNQKQTEQIAQLKKDNEDDDLELEEAKKTQNTEFIKLNYTFFEQVHDLKNKISLLKAKVKPGNFF